MINHSVLRGHSPSILALTVGIVASLVAYSAVREHHRGQSDIAFAAQASNHANAIVNGFSQAVFAIDSVGALYDSSERISWRQFVDFVSPLLERYPTITALGWAPQVPFDDVEAFEQTARELFPGFRITERNAQNNMVGASERQRYFPVYYIHPSEGNDAALGYDLYSSPVRRAAIDRAHESGRTISTARISLVQERANQYSVLLIRPVFQQEHARQDTDRVPGRFLGVASAVFRLGDGVERALSFVRPAGIDIWLLDRSAERDEQFLYFHPSRKSKALDRKQETEPQADAERYVHRFRLGGREFELVLTRTPGYFSSGTDYVAWFALMVCLAFTSLLVAHLEIGARRARELENGNRKLGHQVDERKNVESQLREANRALEILSRVDPVMGIANRRRFDEYIKQEWLRAARQGTPLSLLIGDIDHFKRYNDTYGHVAGDRCLQEVARVLAKEVDRPGDLVARYGGEEIGIVLPATGRAGGRRIAEKVRLAVVSMQIPHKHSPVAEVVTMSIGFGTASPSPKSTADEFLQAVDAALYRAKQEGRNRTVEKAPMADPRSDAPAVPS